MKDSESSEQVGFNNTSNIEIISSKRLGGKNKKEKDVVVIGSSKDKKEKPKSKDIDSKNDTNKKDWL